MTATSTEPAAAPTAALPGATVWLTGLPSAGKTTLARALAAAVRASYPERRVEVLDGDDLRAHLTAGLGFDRADRETNVRRIAFVARLLARNGVLAVVPVIAPYADVRAQVRAEHAADATAYLEVHVATPGDVCAGRDVKGLYARQRAGDLQGLTGVDDPYDEPVDPDLRIHTSGDTGRTDLDAGVAALVALLRRRGLVTGGAA